MSEQNADFYLTATEIEDLKKKALSKLGECRKTNDVIGQQIFSILSLFARVIYYPIGEDGPWGFTRMHGKISTSSSTKPFVAINTSISEDKQVFAAAHELYHIWFERGTGIVTADILQETKSEKSELLANRFAAEFLVEENLLRQEIKSYSINESDISIKDILLLSSLFIVPYRTMVKRLFEINILNNQQKENFLAESEDSLIKLRNRYSLSIPTSDNRIAIDNLVELAVIAYEKGYITYEKLQYLLEINHLVPDDVGISAPPDFIPPSDDELDDIMEE